METLYKTLGVIFVFIGMVVVIAVIAAFPVMWLWNWLMPDIFNLIEINFWQALGLALLSTILFKSTSK